MERDCKIHFRQSDLEIEIEGDREFVEAYFNKLLQRLQFGPSETEKSGNKALNHLLEEKQPSSHSDKVLLFGYYLEKPILLTEVLLIYLVRHILFLLEIQFG